MKKPLPSIAFYGRTSSETQKNEETMVRQVDNFERAWESLKSDYKLVSRFPFYDQSKTENRYFLDPGYNLEEWREDSACHDFLLRCRRGEIKVIFISEIDRLCRSRSAELRGKIQDVLETHDIKIITKNGPVPLGLLFEFLIDFFSG